MVTWRALDRGDELYLTGTGEDAPSLFARAAEELRRRGATPISIKAYGPAGELGAASRVLGAPVTCVESERPGLQAWAARSEVSAVAGGRLWSGPGFRALHLCAVKGRGGAPAEQGAAMFELAGARLAEHGFAWRQVRRTWIYLSRLLEWYGDLNRVRHEAFRREGIDAATGFPASTGIQGRSGGGEECQMDLLAVDGIAARYIRETRCQKEAAAYGSAFSRGVVLERGGRRTIHVSGTASIDAEGRTTHLDDPAGQAEETRRCVGAVLAAEGAGLEDVVSSTLFGRDEAALEAALERLGPLPFPCVPVVANVCRPDLLVELEAVAVA